MLHLAFEPSLGPHCASYVPALKAAINERDAWAFCKALAEINAAFGGLAPSPAHTLDLGAIQDRILQDSYAWLIRPNRRLLSNYIPFSSCVYGELMPAFVDRIIELTQLSSSSLFLDLGSGIGSIVAQASLRTGCTSVGIELVPKVAALAQYMLSQILFRCHMWGVPCSHIKVEQGDMLENSNIAELIQHADVICVNNHAFQPDRLFFLYTLLAMHSHDSRSSQ
jgi:[histone H3]-lysine79 N-trimethyltransferase